MTVDATAIQTLILAEVGDATPPVVEPLMATIWDSYSDKANVAPRLQELYTKRRAIDLLVSKQWPIADVNDGGVGTRLSQVFNNLQAMRARTEEDIERIEARAQANSTPIFGTLANVEPVAPPTSLPNPGPPDADSMVYSGTPYQPIRWNR